MVLQQVLRVVVQVARLLEEPLPKGAVATAAATECRTFSPREAAPAVRRTFYDRSADKTTWSPDQRSTSGLYSC